MWSFKEENEHDRRAKERAKNTRYANEDGRSVLDRDGRHEGRRTGRKRHEG